MRYISIFFTILLIWLAVIVMAITGRPVQEVFEVYLVSIICTLVMFLIGFGKK